MQISVAYHVTVGCSTIAPYTWSLCILGKRHYNTHVQVSQNDIAKDTLDLRKPFRLSRGIPRRRHNLTASARRSSFHEIDFRFVSSIERVTPGVTLTGERHTAVS